MALACFAIGTETDAAAETVKARRTANVHKTAGEQSDVVTTVRAGKSLKVLARSGRWIKVKVNGKVGWIVRSSVVQKTRKRDRNTRRKAFVTGRGKKRGKARIAPRDRIGEDVTDEDAKAVRSVDDRDEELGDDDDELGDDDDDDDSGSRSAAADDDDDDDDDDLGDEDDLTDDEDDLVDDEDEDDMISEDAGPFTHEKFAKRAFALLGVTSMSQKFTSDSGMPLGNYQVSAGSLNIALGGELVYDMGPKYQLGFELGFQYGIASPGIRFQDPDTDMFVDIGYKTLDLDVALKGGYKLSKKRGMVGFLSLGYRRAGMAINNVANITGDNLAALPSETLAGPVVGFELDVPVLFAGLSARATLDTMMIGGGRSQSAGLEDGDVSTAKGLWAKLLVQYAWKRNMNIIGTYEYAWASTDWSGRPASSMRRHDAMTASRSDGSHNVVFGLLRSF